MVSNHETFHITNGKKHLPILLDYRISLNSFLSFISFLPRIVSLSCEETIQTSMIIVKKKKRYRSFNNVQLPVKQLLTPIMYFVVCLCIICSMFIFNTIVPFTLMNNVKVVSNVMYLSNLNFDLNKSTSFSDG